MKSWKTRLGLGLLLAAALALAQAEAKGKKARKEAAPAAMPAPAQMTVADVRSCMRKNLVDRAALRDLKLNAIDREGNPHPFQLRLYWKPSKAGEPRMNLRVVAPAELAGSSYLLLGKKSGEEVYVYLAANKKTQKINGQDMNRPLWGTDFTYSEIKQVQGILDEGRIERKADGTVGKHATFVLETSTEPEMTGYQKIINYVDQQSCTLLKSEFFGKDGKRRKLLEADLTSLLQVDTYWIVLNYAMSDEKQGTKTELSLSDLTLLEGSPEWLFNPERFFEEYK